MNKYKVFCEFFGKKMSKEVEATDKYDAEDQVRNLLDIHEVRLIDGTERKFSKDPMVDKLKKCLGIL